ncbi:hypothetical protein [Paenibacillus faecalis]|uniref:hypothetical protein n=1 Tax=Paenibacillus faecalis TaxID=2079532 RepID=UPI000D0F2109|nr:hypothetical protein [Paenibacillus faecalis]
MNHFIASMALLVGIFFLVNTVDETQVLNERHPSQGTTVTKPNEESQTSKSFDYVVWNGGHIYKVIPHAKLPKSKVGKQAGEVQRQQKDAAFTGGKGKSELADGDSSLPVGTKIYQFKYGPSIGVIVMELNGEFVKAVKIR